MAKSIFNKGAFKIKAKIIDQMKGLDGRINLSIQISHFESGMPVIEIIEVNRDCMGKISGVTV